ncbi:BMP family ABC transporter substrate-binding protein [Clostridioides sp. ZZV15-6383]|uniref:BMP family ABC transporter substrate-binding protein n=1 Tax=unclassified Clostridioides TaxID=2635829 RepID=UPI001D124AA9|nr:BMP family ABC transporter substrate-binding protein [Clostridioides sp. ZZV14-6345]MCC0698977.1 BMP family ABC transporter substrate-binding protein [Clostridioides sp. ZZV15-6383]
MRFKKILVMILTVAMTAGMLVGCDNNSSNNPSSNKNNKNNINNENNSKKSVSMILDIEGTNNEDMNNSALLALNNAQKKFNIDINKVESDDSSTFDNSIDILCNDNYDLIIAVGARFAKPLEKIAKKYPKQQFAIVDYEYDKQPSNITSISYEDNKSGYLAGLIAGKMTESNKVGFIGGIKGSSRDKFEAGFKEGVKFSNSSIKDISVEYVDVFKDSKSVESIAKKMMDNGVDIIFSTTEDDSKAVIDAVRAKNKKVIATNKDQHELAPENVIGSIVKDFENPTYNLIQSFVKGNYKGGKVIENTVESGSTGLAKNSSQNIPPDVLEYVNKNNK